MSEQKTLHEKLVHIQGKLDAPKNQRNTFGNFNYRSAEDILEGVKKLAFDLNCTVILSDEIVLIGQLVYVKATASISDGKEVISNSAFAREAMQKKGMDEMQLTGAASSYARKYAMNGLFAIDDSKDADTDEHRQQTQLSSNDKKNNFHEADQDAIKEYSKKYGEIKFYLDNSLKAIEGAADLQGLDAVWKNINGWRPLMKRNGYITEDQSKSILGAYNSKKEKINGRISE